MADQPQKDTESGWSWTSPKQRAAALLAEDELTDEEIADEVGVIRRTIARWKLVPEFAARVRELADDLGGVARRYAIGRKSRRMREMDRRWRAMRAVIDERAASPEMLGVPGGSSGLLVRTVKVVGSGPAAQTVEEFAVDTGLLREIREVEKQAAAEAGDGGGGAEDEPEFPREEE